MGQTRLISSSYVKRDLESLRKQWFSFVFSPARRLLPLPSASSIINFDWVNLVFAAPSLIFRGREAGLLHAY